MGGVTVFSGPERRRRWSDEGRGRILAEAFAPGACAAEVARRHDVSTGLLYTWRKKLGGDFAGTGFAEALVGDTPELPAMSSAAVVIEMASGGRVHVSAATPPALVAAVLKALR